MYSARSVSRGLAAVLLIVVWVSGCRDEAAVVGPLPDTQAATIEATAAATHVVRDEANRQTVQFDGERNEQNVAQSGTGNIQWVVATGDGNVQDLTQEGDGNRQSGTADGDANTQTAVQAGSGNEQSAGAAGDGNAQGIGQDGIGNLQSASANGDASTQTVTQDGTGNQQRAVADGGGNTQDVVQTGDRNEQSATADGARNTQDQEQSGSDNRQTSTADGDANTQTAAQAGSGNEQSAAVEGDGNDQHVVQDGETNRMVLEQTGTALRARSEQQGRGNRLRVRQDGSNLQLVSDQAGADVGASVVQQGEYNRLVVRGDLLAASDGRPPLLSFEQQPTGGRSSAAVVWTDPRLQLTDRGHNALRIHYGERSEHADGHQTITITSPGEAWQVTAPLGELPAHGSMLIRYADFTRADAASTRAALSDVHSLGMRLESSDAFVNVLFIETVRVVDTRIEIKAGGEATPINPGARGVLPVVVFGHAELNVTEIEPASLDLLGMPLRSRERPRHDPTWMISFEDVDDDGVLDAILHFEQAGWSAPDEAGHQDAVVTGTLRDGTLLVGTTAAYSS